VADLNEGDGLIESVSLDGLAVSARVGRAVFVLNCAAACATIRLPPIARGDPFDFVFVSTKPLRWRNGGPLVPPACTIVGLPDGDRTRRLLSTLTYFSARDGALAEDGAE
jgi:hypothetical protein